MNNETTQELQIIDPKEYGLEEVKATEMTSGLNSIIEERTALESIFNDVILKELNADTLKEARELRLKIQKNRTQGIDVWHKTNKEFYLAGGRFVDAVKNREIAINSRLESKLGEIENHFKDLEEQRLNNLYTERVALLEPYGEVNKFVDLKQMDETTFNNFLSDTKLAFETRKENERKAEEKRIADEKKAEDERLKKEAELKSEQDRIKAENEKLRLENEAKEQEIEKQKEYHAQQIHKQNELHLLGFRVTQTHFVFGDNQIEIKVGDLHDMSMPKFFKYLESVKEQTAEIIKHEKAKQDEKDRLAKIESDRLAKIQEDKDAEIAKLKAEQETEKQRKEKELADDKARIEADEADKLAKEKALANAGDKDKIKEWFPKYVSLMDSFPELTSIEGIELMNRAKEALLMVKKLIATDSKKLL